MSGTEKPPLSKDQEKLLVLLYRDGTLLVHEIASRLAWEPAKVERVLRELQKFGYVGVSKATVN